MQEPVIEDVRSSSAYSKYQTFFNNVDIDNAIVIPGLKTTMVPQGMCKNGDYIYVSAYDHTGSNYSCVYLINALTGRLVKTLRFKDSFNHVGGVATDGTYLYVCCNHRIGIIKLTTLHNANDGDNVVLTYIPVKTDTGSELACSFCSYDSYKNLLWVGTFNADEADYAYGFKTNGTESLTLTTKISVPAKTQGIFFIDNYVYFSTSYGRNNASNIYKCTISGSGLNYTYTVEETIEAPPTSEGIFIENNKLYILFENAASYFYNDTSNPTQYAVDRIFAYNL